MKRENVQIAPTYPLPVQGLSSYRYSTGMVRIGGLKRILQCESPCAAAQLSRFFQLNLLVMDHG